jgi:hypothetical protein
MQTNFKPGYDKAAERGAVIKDDYREIAADWLFRAFQFCALFLVIFGGMNVLQSHTDSINYVHGLLDIGLGAVVYLTGWCIRFLITGARSLV